jgi:biopolymer transport protein ExbB/TolQ
MNRSRLFSFEFIYQLAALALSWLVVHTSYRAVVRPNAEAAIEAARAAAAEDGPAPTASWWVILKDPEQESCFVLLGWALAIIAYKFVQLARARALLDRDLVPVAEGMRILPEDAREHARGLEALPPGPRDTLLPRALLTGLHRFGATRSLSDAAAAMHEACTQENDRMESELSLIRYIAWAIPSIGFIGTVRGIGAALQNAQAALNGDISGVTLSLGTAFNSTLIALFISIALMFVVHQLQLRQERTVLEAKDYCDTHLARHLHPT